MEELSKDILGVGDKMFSSSQDASGMRVVEYEVKDREYDHANGYLYRVLMISGDKKTLVSRRYSTLSHLKNVMNIHTSVEELVLYNQRKIKESIESMERLSLEYADLLTTYTSDNGKNA
jgi:hypothetical protein